MCMFSKSQFSLSDLRIGCCTGLGLGLKPNLRMKFGFEFGRSRFPATCRSVMY